MAEQTVEQQAQAPELMTAEQVEAATAAFAAALDQMSEAERAEFQQLAQRWMAAEIERQQKIEELRPYAEAMELRNQASAKFAEADLEAHRRKLEAKIPPAREALVGAERAEQAAKARIAPAQEAERVALERAEQAEMLLVAQQDAYDAVAATRGMPATEMAALVRRNAAEEVFRKAAADAQGAALAREQAEAQARAAVAATEAAQNALWDAEDALQAAARTVRPSTVTLMYDFVNVLGSGTELTPVEMGIVRVIVSGLSAQTGADQMIKKQALEQARKERRAEFDAALALVPSPQNGNILMPLDQQRDPRGDGRRRG